MAAMGAATFIVVDVGSIAEPGGEQLLGVVWERRRDGRRESLVGLPVRVRAERNRVHGLHLTHYKLQLHSHV